MNILILPGDGIGKEICFEVEKLFKELISIFSIDINCLLFFNGRRKEKVRKDLSRTKRRRY